MPHYKYYVFHKKPGKLCVKVYHNNKPCLYIYLLLKKKNHESSALT